MWQDFWDAFIYFPDDPFKLNFQLYFHSAHSFTTIVMNTALRCDCLMNWCLLNTFSIVLIYIFSVYCGGGQNQAELQQTHCTVVVWVERGKQRCEEKHSRLLVKMVILDSLATNLVNNLPQNHSFKFTFYLSDQFTLTTESSLHCLLKRTTP